MNKMETEVKTPQQIETYENPIVVDKIKGIHQSHSYIGWLDGRIKIFLKRNNQEMVNILNTCKKSYLVFHPILKASVPLQQFKGKSGLRINPYPNYYETIEFRKTDTEIKKIKHRIPKWKLKQLIQAINPLSLNKKYKTRYVAQEYLKCAGIEGNSKKRKFFDEKGFDFEKFFGSRDIYCPFNLMLKILQYYEFIKYYKNGEILRLKNFNNFEVQGEFE